MQGTSLQPSFPFLAEGQDHWDITAWLPLNPQDGVYTLPIGPSESVRSTPMSATPPSLPSVLPEQWVYHIRETSSVLVSPVADLAVKLHVSYEGNVPGDKNKGLEIGQGCVKEQDWSWAVPLTPTP